MCGNLEKLDVRWERLEMLNLFCDFGVIFIAHGILELYYISWAKNSDMSSEETSSLP